MKNPLIYIRKSLSRRLSIIIVLIATIIFVAALGFVFVESRKAVRQEAINRATKVLDNTVLRVNSLLNRVVIASDNFIWLPGRNVNKPDSMFAYSKHLLMSNPDINGCSIAFEPDFYKDKGKGRYFSAFSYNNQGTIETTQEGNDQYEYFYMDWYQLPKLLDRPCWIEPFADYNPEEIYSTEVIASYCRPIKDAKGTYVGTLSVDVSMEWISQTISAVKPQLMCRWSGYPRRYQPLSHILIRTAS